MLRGAIILNGISRKKRLFYSTIEPKLSEKFDIQIFETQYAGHAISLAAECAAMNFDFILAAGGDGTLHQVVNGLLSVPHSRTPLGVIPLGTGNDFARTCGLHTNAENIIGLILRYVPRPTDIGILKSADEAGRIQVRYFINCCSMGMGPEVVKRLESSNRKLGPAITYLKAIIKTFIHLKPPLVHYQIDDRKFEGRVLVLGIANGQSFGNAIYLAPDAAVDDGWFNVFTALDMSIARLLLLLTLIKQKKMLKSPKVFYHKIKNISFSSPESCSLETEGEAAGFLPASIEVLPGRVMFFR